MRTIAYSGAIPNKSADTKTDITPKKNETFSRVRITFEECHVVTSDCIRAETCISESEWLACTVARQAPSV